ncbi:UDP-glucose 4-epimerase family protein [Thiomicrorhabdus sp.]|uniref:UDP-glucose 4-epimerase family protein n=1 Tax=Thiomicrorhabdus sp. TaxID=2039724 RepID=UPI0035678363
MILVTGATGFVGQALVSELFSRSIPVKALVRMSSGSLPEEVEQIEIGDLSILLESKSSLVDLREKLNNVDVVVHAAARVHMMQDVSDDPLSEFRKVNRDVTLSLARLAAEAGVKRFVFLSSIKVNGEMTQEGQVFTPEDKYIPTDPYGLSKYEAEMGLLKLAEDTGMEVVIIRPPLVYGPGVRANFASMIRWVHKGIPLPLGAVNNSRSLVALENLVDFLALCSDRQKSPKASNQVFLISDGEDVSTTQLLRKVAKALNDKIWLIPVPTGMMVFATNLVGKRNVAKRLFGSLQIDSCKARDLLGWTPVISMDEQLIKMVKVDLEKNDV